MTQSCKKDSKTCKIQLNYATGPIIVNELKDAFFLITTNKCPGHDEISNLTRSCYGELCESLQYLFNLSFEKSIFPNDLKIAKVTPIFKAGNNV